MIGAVIKVFKGEDEKKGLHDYPRSPVSDNIVTTFVLEESKDTKEEQPLNAKPVNPGYLSFNVLSPSQHDINEQHQLNGNVFQPNEWGVISSEKQDDALKLEVAMFCASDSITYRAIWDLGKSSR